MRAVARTERDRRPRPPDPHVLRRRRAGLTLIEMVIVVATLAVLAAATLPRFQQYIHRSRRTEAIYGLRTIHDLQLAFFAKDMQYSDSFEEIGLPLESGKLREDGAFQGPVYTFTLDTWDLGTRPNANYRATATADLDSSDTTLDILIIENRVTVHD